MSFKNPHFGDFPVGPVVNSPSNAGVVGLIPDWEARFSTASRPKNQNTKQNQHHNQFIKTFKMVHIKKEMFKKIHTLSSALDNSLNALQFRNYGFLIFRLSGLSRGLSDLIMVPPSKVHASSEVEHCPRSAKMSVTTLAFFFSLACIVALGNVHDFDILQYFQAGRSVQD